MVKRAGKALGAGLPQKFGKKEFRVKPAVSIECSKTQERNQTSRHQIHKRMGIFFVAEICQGKGDKNKHPVIFHGHGRPEKNPEKNSVDEGILFQHFQDWKKTGHKHKKDRKSTRLNSSH